MNSVSTVTKGWADRRAQASASASVEAMSSMAAVYRLVEGRGTFCLRLAAKSAGSLTSFFEGGPGTKPINLGYSAKREVGGQCHLAHRSWCNCPMQETVHGSRRSSTRGRASRP